MTWEWLKDIGWLGTTIVALGGLAATVWTGRRSGQIQLAVQERQLVENRRVLVWQERRTAYAQFLKQFQEYFDKTVVQEQLGSIIKDGEDTHPSVVRIMASDLDEDEKNRLVLEWRLGATDYMQGEFGVLTMREGWAVLTQVRDAANQARLIAPLSVRGGIEALMEASTKEEIEAAVKADQMVEEFRARIEAQKIKLNELMNDDLLSEAAVVAQIK